MAWNTKAIQKLIDNTPDRYPADHLAHIAPVAFRHINIQGKLHFPIAGYGALGLAGSKTSTIG